MMDQLGRAERLRSERTPFVLATVVRAERPTSAKTGDRALVLPDGTLEGFVGGSCAASTVRAQALALLDSGESTLLRITPGADEGADASEGLVTVSNPCLSGGTLDLFLEAVIPPALIQVYGDGPIARALADVGTAAGYDLRPTADLDAPVIGDAAALVVATHGHNEEAILRAALDAGIPYIGLIASRKRGAAVTASIEGGDRVHSPAGLDIGARTAPEIALSLLAEILSLRPRAARRAVHETRHAAQEARHEEARHEESHHHCH
ncbi:XdhC family protein [Actinomadura sp. NBRC 104412]|uniref:XdhC family protein n=1 Tax=Actinomadura sp. NBRC 104412 TaxID=3032203 RepID=UPI0025542891|nr:XdhC family protein [Actinomadura sp. NBRC 104412]